MDDAGVPVFPGPGRRPYGQGREGRDAVGDVVHVGESGGTEHAEDRVCGCAVVEREGVRASGPYNRANGDEVSAELTTYDAFKVTGGIPGPFGIQHHPVVFLDVASETTMTTQGGVPRARQHTVRHAYEHAFGREVWTEDGGDPATGVGRSCDYTVHGGWDAGSGTWMPNLDTWVIEAPRQQLSTSTACPATVTDVPTADLVGRQDLYYGSDWSDLSGSPARRIPPGRWTTRRGDAVRSVGDDVRRAGPGGTGRSMRGTSWRGRRRSRRRVRPRRRRTPRRMAWSRRGRGG